MSLERDRDLKIPRYAAAGVTVARRQTLQPLLLPGVTITVDAILG